jgi:activator of HSP90 ATPase
MTGSWYAGDLPTFEEIRVEMLKQLRDALDTARSDWAEGHGPNVKAADHMAMARQHVALACERLDAAARAESVAGVD